MSKAEDVTRALQLVSEKAGRCNINTLRSRFSNDMYEGLLNNGYIARHGKYKLTLTEQGAKRMLDMEVLT